jgi:hypothetical protein
MIIRIVLLIAGGAFAFAGLCWVLNRWTSIPRPDKCPGCGSTMREVAGAYICDECERCLPSSW